MQQAEDDSRHWRSFQARRNRLRPPLGVDPAVVQAMRESLGEAARALLVLGATPELGALSDAITMLDWSQEMIESVWRPAWPRTRAIRADWRVWKSAERFTGAAGDGSLSMLAWPHDWRTMLANLVRLVAPGGKVAIRLFLSPDQPELLADLAAAGRTGTLGGFHALKWRIAHALAHQQGDPNVAVRDIREAFNTLFPDRAALAESCGWSLAQIAEIDAYAGSPLRYAFPTAGQLAATIPEGFAQMRLVPSGSYELAERCPLLVLTRAA